MQKRLKMVTLVIVNCLLISGISLATYGQKLPNVQEGSVWAPTTTRVDARLTEWDGMLQADNKNLDVSYTIANDDKNLYIAIKSINPVINNKIMAGGIDLTINTNGKKKDKNPFVLTFPVVNVANLRSQVMSRMGRGGPGGPPQPMDSAAIASMRKAAIKAAKEVKLIGFSKDIPDSVISIYNEYGIKAAIDYDRNGSLICEMALPLKYIFPEGKGKDFAYNLKLNGLNINALFPGAGAMFGGGPPGGGGGFGGPPGGGGGGGFGGPPGGGGGFGGGGGGFGGGRPPAGMPSMSDMQNMISPTDVWGKYTLAKK